MYMRKGILKKLSLVMVLLFMTVFVMPAGMAQATQSLKTSAIQFLEDDFSNDGMANSDNGVGSYALYVLEGAGVAAGDWQYDGSTLSELVTNAVSDDISNAADPSTPTSAKLLSQDLAAAQTLERDDLAADLVSALADRQTWTGFDSSLFSNMPAFDLLGRLGYISEMDTGQARDYILGQQSTTVANDVYSWGFTYGDDYYPDFIATAQAVRALHYLDPDSEDNSIQDAINNALDWMENQQQDDGSFVAGYPGMDDPMIDACQAIATLCALDMDVESWLSSEDNSALDYLENNALNDDGSFGSGKNVMDAVTFLYAYNLVAVDEDELYIDPASPTLEVDETLQLQAMFTSGGDTVDVTGDAEWSVDDDAVATVDGGLLTAFQEGQTTVTAAYNGFEATAAVTVELPSTNRPVSMAVIGLNEELLFGPAEISVPLTNQWGQTVLGALDESGIAYTTANWPDYGDYVDSIMELANSGSKGWMYAVNDQAAPTLPGSCEIQSGDKIIWYYSASMDQPAPTWAEITGKLTIDPASATFAVNKTKQLQALYNTGGETIDVAQDAEWSTDDGAIAGIENGLLTGLKAGETVATAVYNGYQATCSVKVTSSGGGGSGGDEGSGTEVKMAVLGPENDLLYGPSEFTVPSTNPYGQTVLGALDASGADYTTSTWDWGEYVNSIEGIASSGDGGWMFAVNGEPATQGAEETDIAKGDKIVWYWATGMGQQPPDWDDLVAMRSSGSGTTEEVKKEKTDLVSDTDLKAAIENLKANGKVMLTAAEGKELLALTRDQFSKIASTGQPLAVTVQGMQFILSPDALKLPLFSDGSKVVFSAHKLSAWAVINQAPVNGKLKLGGDIFDLEVLVEKADGTQQKLSNAAGVRIILPVPAGFLDTAGDGRLQVYRYNESSQTWQYVGGAYDAGSQTIGFDTAHFSKYALLLPTATFDDISGHWAQKVIEFMASNGYVSGSDNNRFLPDAKITRAEFVAIITRVAGLSAQAGKKVAFTDIPADAWYREAVDIGVSNGLVFGMDNNTFAPDDQVTREQMAAILVRLLEQKGNTADVSEAGAGQLLDRVADQASISSWARVPIAVMVREKIMEGRDNGWFAPQDHATRAEAAMMIYRVLNRLL